MVSSKSSILFWKDSLSEEILTDKYPVTDSYFYRYLIPSIHQQFYVWGAGCRSGIGEELLTYTLTTSSSGAVVTQVVGAFPLQPLPMTRPPKKMFLMETMLANGHFPSHENVRPCHLQLGHLSSMKGTTIPWLDIRLLLLQATYQRQTCLIHWLCTKTNINRR